MLFIILHCSKAKGWRRDKRKPGLRHDQLSIVVIRLSPITNPCPVERRRDEECFRFDPHIIETRNGEHHAIPEYDHFSSCVRCCGCLPGNASLISSVGGSAIRPTRLLRGLLLRIR